MRASLLFITYQHERFVAEAIRAAMAQDYPDLEIVLCDDGSTDRTREFVERELAACPPHIRIVRASVECNGGFHANFNRGMAACSGEIIVAMSGDDISLPNRVSKVVREFETHPQCMVVCNNWTRIDATGEHLDDGLDRDSHSVHRYREKTRLIYASAPVCGATAAYRSTLRDTFGPMMQGHHGEDNCFWVRALLLGAVHYLPERLVKWRSHATNLSNWQRISDTPEERTRHLRYLRVHQGFSPQWRKDLEHARQLGLISPDLHRRVGSIIDFERESQRLRRYSIIGAPWRLWCGAARRVVAARPTLKTVLRTYRGRLSLRLVPQFRARYWRRYFRQP